MTENLATDKQLIQQGNITTFKNVQKMVMDPEYRNGSLSFFDGLQISAQGKLEMLQSLIYPPKCGVPSELFFIVKI